MTTECSAQPLNKQVPSPEPYY